METQPIQQCFPPAQNYRIGKRQNTGDKGWNVFLLNANG